MPMVPRRAAPIAENAALPNGSPIARDKPKSISPPIIGSLFKRGLVNFKTVFAPDFPTNLTAPDLAALVNLDLPYFPPRSFTLSLPNLSIAASRPYLSAYLLIILFSLALYCAFDQSVFLKTSL